MNKNLTLSWYIILFFTSINFLGNRNVNVLLLILFGTYWVYRKNLKYEVDLSFLLLLLFSVLYFAMVSVYRTLALSTFLYTLVGPILLYIIGFSIIEKGVSIIINSFVIISFGYFIHGILNFTQYIRIYGINSILRVVPDFWNGKIYVSTLVGIQFALLASLLFIGVVYLSKKDSFIKGIILLVCILSSVFASFILGNRTLILLIFTIFSINTYFYIRFHKIKIQKTEFLNIWVKFKLLILTLSYFLLGYITNVFKVRDLVEGSKLYQRFNLSLLIGDPRIKIYSEIFNQILIYPFGGEQMLISLPYAHNLWLDIMFVSGLIPFLVILSFTILIFVNIRRLIKSRYIAINAKLFILSIYFGFILIFMVEPVMDGAPYYYLAYCLFCGMLNKLVIIKRL